MKFVSGLLLVWLAAGAVCGPVLGRAEAESQSPPVLFSGPRGAAGDSGPFLVHQAGLFNPATWTSRQKIWGMAAAAALLPLLLFLSKSPAKGERSRKTHKSMGEKGWEYDRSEVDPARKALKREKTKRGWEYDRKGKSPRKKTARPLASVVILPGETPAARKKRIDGRTPLFPMKFSSPRRPDFPGAPRRGSQGSSSSEHKKSGGERDE
ncbi:MAG: hypothetical protein JXB25_07460 [Deltaproteobacteria bacterium]|nr:hypothetical protein [Deltaproteobacteria bacterium]